MNREETKKILMAMITYFPNFKAPDTDEALNAWLTLWQDMFSDTPYEDVAMGLKAYVKSDSKGFAPSIGQLNNIICNIQEQTVSILFNDMEAWALVSNALRNSAWHSEEEYAKLPPLVQKAVGSPQNLRNWATTDIRTVENVIMSDFQRTYRDVVSRERMNRRMPIDVQHLIAQHQNENLRIGGGEDD